MTLEGEAIRDPRSKSAPSYYPSGLVDKDPMRLGLGPGGCGIRAWESVWVVHEWTLYARLCCMECLLLLSIYRNDSCRGSCCLLPLTCTILYG